VSWHATYGADDLIGGNALSLRDPQPSHPPFTPTTVFGTPTEVTLSELALEMLFPADPATIAIVKAMVEEEAAQVIESGLPSIATPP
jgi:hypothetical protein